MTPHERAFRDEMARNGAASVTVWGNAPGDAYPSHAHDYRKLLCCLEGSIVFHLPDGDVSLRPGDRMVVEPGLRHSACVGSDGVRCAEAHFGLP